MHVKIEVTKTYWVGVDAEQKEDLLSGTLIALDAITLNPEIIVYTPEQAEALNALRLALLNA